MAENDLITKTINEINVAENRFFVPDYQRGYRWKEPEIHALLDGILAHIDRRPEPERDYCLQPVVVAAREDGAWEVIDGQQRLTTIYIILRYLNSEETAFSIELSRREDSQEFLANLSSAEPENEEDTEAWRTTAAGFNRHSRRRNSLKQKFFIDLYESILDSSTNLFAWPKEEDNDFDVRTMSSYHARGRHINTYGRAVEKLIGDGDIVWYYESRTSGREIDPLKLKYNAVRIIRAIFSTVGPDG